MYRVSVMYPNEPGARFDHDYYRTTHMALVREHLGPHGLVRTGVDRGVSGGGGERAPYICVGYLYFETADGYDNAVKAAGSVLRDDIPNFTNVRPTRLIAEVLDE